MCTAALVLTAAREFAMTAQDEVHFFFKSEYYNSDIHMLSELYISANKFIFKIIFYYVNVMNTHI